MRILFSIHLFPPKHCCGSEMVALHVCKYMISQGHKCRVILHRYNGAPYQYEGVEVLPATGHLDAYRWATHLATHLDFTQYTLMISNEIQRPLIHFVHNDINYPSIRHSERGQYVVYNSNWIADKINYRHPYCILHPPCNTSLYNVNEAPENNEYITLISLNERKGGWIFKQIAEAMPDRKFLGVVGSYDNAGPLKLSQSDIIKAMPSNVTVVPNSPDILSVYKKTRVLLMPSDYESWGRTATEAMCNGIPVICTPTDGLRENCADAGIFVGSPKYDPEPGAASVHTGMIEDWIKAIQSLDDKNYYHEKSVACRSRAAQLSPDMELQELERLFFNARF